MSDPKWRQFETAVASFISALDPCAKVVHDAIIPDHDTGTPRQRDVWIETKVCDHFLLKILVSCKKYKRKLDQQHIDAFIGELLSSGAQKGVIYSFSGFTKPALDKAVVKGISCCRLYQDEVPELPESLIFDAYLLTPVVYFFPFRFKELEEQPETIADLLNLELPGADKSKYVTVLDLLELKYYEQQEQVKTNARISGKLPTEWTDGMSFSDPNTHEELLALEFGGRWDVYKASLEGYLLNGSYSFTEKEFKGKQSFPEISERGPHPGENWTKVNQIPDELDKRALIACLYGPVNVREELKKIGNMKIPSMQD